MSTSITVVCYKSKTLSNGEHPLMLRICQDRKTKYQSLGVSIAEKHWDFEKNSPKSKCPNRDILIKLILKVQMEYQQKLLENAYFLLKNGGRIVYSTCTINKKENGKQIETFIKNHSDMKKIEETTILPYQYHSDGFYMCLLEKE